MKKRPKFVSPETHFGRLDRAAHPRFRFRINWSVLSHSPGRHRPSVVPARFGSFAQPRSLGFDGPTVIEESRSHGWRALIVRFRPLETSPEARCQRALSSLIRPDKRRESVTAAASAPDNYANCFLRLTRVRTRSASRAESNGFRNVSLNIDRSKPAALSSSERRAMRTVSV